MACPEWDRGKSAASAIPESLDSRVIIVAEPRSVLVVDPAAIGFDHDHSIGQLAIGDRRGGAAEDSYRPNLRGRDLVQDLKAWRCS